MSIKIDAHHHFWRYNTADYGWIPDEMSVLRRDFLPDDLRREIQSAGIDRVISVQARQSIEETDWLLQLAAQNDFVAGVVGWLPLASEAFPALLERYAANPKLRALRHVVQDEPDDRFILGEAFNRGVAQLRRYHLAYDILIFERHLPFATAFVDRHADDQIFVLDHIAKPKIKAGEIEPWAKNLRELAKRPNVRCKLSGMVTEANLKYWVKADLTPYMDTVLEAFGADRVLFGTDWPVCTSATTYRAWKELVEDFSGTEQDKIMGENARNTYGV